MDACFASMSPRPVSTSSRPSVADCHRSRHKRTALPRQNARVHDPAGVKSAVDKASTTGNWPSSRWWCPTLRQQSHDHRTGSSDPTPGSLRQDKLAENQSLFFQLCFKVRHGLGTLLATVSTGSVARLPFSLLKRLLRFIAQLSTSHTALQFRKSRFL